MSVGVLPYGGGLLHVGPVECKSCNSREDAGNELGDDRTLPVNYRDAGGASDNRDAIIADHRAPNLSEGRQI
jgi:hypothetical protein